MKRRDFLLTALAASAMPLSASASEFVEYAPGVIEAALQDGKTVLVDYAAKWCSTCKRQARVINALREGDPAYDAAMIFVKVDWDLYKSHDVTLGRGVPRRSTLILLRGEEELGRLVAATGEDEIKDLLNRGL